MRLPLSWIRSLNPLASLTGRIFIWFWLTLVLISMVSFLVLQQWARPYDLTDLTPDEEQLLVYQRDELEGYLEAGMTPLQAIRYASIRFGLDLYLVDPNFRLLGTPQPDQIELYMIGAMVESGDPLAATWEDIRWIGAMPLRHRGETYRVLIKTITDTPANRLLEVINERLTWTLLALLVSGMLSLWLANSLSRPLRLLRTTSRSLASGKLESRVPAVVSRRADDIGQLGQDFDHMAERLQSLIEAQQKLLSNISHELRSPLTRLQIALGIARQRVEDDSAAPQLDRIEREAQRLEAMIAQLLQLSRLENRLQHMDMQPIDLGKMLRTIADDANFEARAQNREVTLKSALPVRVIGDQMLLNSAIENVVRNAVKYTPEESEVVIDTAQQGEWVIIQVEDAGTGVPAQDLPHLFEPFFRATNTQQGGSGLGLSITRQAVEAHNGTVRAENVEGGGLRITLTLPISLQLPSTTGD
ncbi:HAMP domain-containing protein [Natronospirillum operosum]|uniref:histidine kinase n=1 Tax=Natronospirillum operosum TaxID=2759953 RepID=A0A4Z0W8G6_9GAMM|nr:ATP-binding protein [Natronospirillum operosum]TGG93239.1 HAMP domain-containing protein [Natronospirillum operosum]